MKKKQTYEQSLAAEKNLAKARATRRADAEARREARQHQQAKTSEQMDFEARYKEAREAHNTLHTEDTFLALQELRREAQQNHWPTTTF